MEKEKKTKKQYMIAYYYPRGTKNVNFLYLNADNLKDALVISKCLFGKTGYKNLYLKEKKID